MMLYKINTGFEVLANGAIAASIAQILKFIGFYARHKKINFKTFVTAGGMPSSHSAGVIGIATTVGLIKGFNSVEFAITFGYSLVVMYDAAGVRRSAGNIAASLNKMTEDFYAHRPSAAGEKLKELLGHTPFEVFVGAILGAAVSFFIHTVIL